VEIRTVVSQPAKFSVSALLILAYEDENDRFDPWVKDLDKSIRSELSRLEKLNSIRGKFKEQTLFHPDSDEIDHVIVVGVGKRNEFSLDKLRSAVAAASQVARKLSASGLGVPLGKFLSLPSEAGAAAAVEGAILGLYQFKKYKNAKSDEDNHQDFPRMLGLIGGDKQDAARLEKGCDRGKILGESNIFVRDLVNEPSNVMTPTAFAHEAEAAAKKFGLEIKVIEKREMEKLGMGGILGVARGSHQPPKLLLLKYKGGSGKSFSLGLVGKGVTFDSGGISIKPSENMHHMTGDMAGAAACLGAMIAIARLKIPINLITLLPLAENLPGGNAYKPGDIVKIFNGKTVEIINTDAEGRMLLADALSYMQTMPVDAVVDLATLTGGIVVALGAAATGLFSTDEGLTSALLKAGEASEEMLWRMPLLPMYTKMVKGQFADLKNSAGRFAAACTAAAFLKEFAGEKPWAHLDIAATAHLDSPLSSEEHLYLPKYGATGAGVRILTVLAERLSEKGSLS